MKKKLSLLFLSLLCVAQAAVYGAPIQWNGNGIQLNLKDIKAGAPSNMKKAPSSSFSVYRAKGRLAKQEFIGTFSGDTFTDNNMGSNSPYDYYYFVKQGDAVVAMVSLETELFGENVYIFGPNDNHAEITKEVNRIGTQTRYTQFGDDRYTIFFKPGDYRDTELMHVGFYTQVAGLGKCPKDVRMFNFNTPSPLATWADPNDTWSWNAINATCTFWRSIENLAVMYRDGEARDDDPSHFFIWGVSQAAPLRRVYTDRYTTYDYLAGWASGGFTADCYFDNSVGSYSQQQWYTRNSYMKKGSQGLSKGGWNTAYQGVEFGSGVNMADHSDNWSDMAEAPDGASLWGNVSREETTPIIREKPFIFLGDDGRYKVFKPALRENAVGTSWKDGNMGEGEVIDILDNFYVAKPGDNAAKINEQLREGKHLIFTPGIYKVEKPIKVCKPNSIVLGMGYATLVPTAENNDCALKVTDVDGVTVAGLLFDTEYSSRNLFIVGELTSTVSHADNPTVVSDIFCRVGGVYSKAVNVDQAVVIKSNNVIGDHFWIWRADHGEGTGWNKNTSKNGLVVHGNDVTIYCLCNEHFQEYQTLWTGENGRMYFYQCETPYDPQDQADYLSHVDRASGQQAEGYSAYKVAKGVKKHYASMLGIYDVFIYTNGAYINIRNSIELPKGEPDVKIHHACNVCISSLEQCGFQYICGDVCQSTYYANTEGGAVSKRFHVKDFNGTQVQTPDWIVDADKYLISGINSTDGDNANIDVKVVPGTRQVAVSAPSQDYTVSVYDARGALVRSGKNLSSVDLSGSASGIYLVSVTPHKGNKVVKKIVF